LADIDRAVELFEAMGPAGAHSAERMRRLTPIDGRKSSAASLD